ncbi:MAG: DUF2220 domain-containing protein [Clostridiales bacterium]|nr:DUF2220 domain-containing protein [Clostridiales bacterium]
MLTAYSSTHKRILNALLDKYERSGFFRDKIKPNRRIMLGFYNGGKSDFPFYDIEQSDRRIEVNRAVEALADDGLLFFDWMKGEQGHILARVWLNLDRLPAVYAAADREAKNEAIERVCAEIAAVQSRIRSPWIAAYLKDTMEEIQRKQSMISGMPAADQERSFLLQALASIDQLEGREQMERVFSLHAFGDSKRFERSARSRILRILRKYLAGEIDVDSDSADEDLLRQIGIVQYPEQFEFCGSLSVMLHGKQVDFSCLSGGGAIYSSDFSSSAIEISSRITSVISIENRANYFDYLHNSKADNELVIYHSGMYSPRKKQFLQSIADAMPMECVWTHWGDIDYGGFLMLARLRREIRPDVTPYRMNQAELEQYSHFAIPITKAYADKLESLLARPELADCTGCIEYLLQKGLRLEQEAMLL